MLHALIARLTREPEAVRVCADRPGSVELPLSPARAPDTEDMRPTAVLPISSVNEIVFSFTDRDGRWRTLSFSRDPTLKLSKIEMVILSHAFEILRLFDAPCYEGSPLWDYLRNEEQLDIRDRENRRMGRSRRRGGGLAPITYED